MKEPQFKRLDIVKHKILPSPIMMVDNIVPEKQNNDFWYHCCWFANEAFFTAYFGEDELMKN